MIFLSFSPNRVPHSHYGVQTEETDASGSDPYFCLLTESGVVTALLPKDSSPHPEPPKRAEQVPHLTTASTGEEVQ